MRRLRELGDLVSTGSWRIVIDAPRELGFAAYIGRVEHFSLDEGSPASSKVEAEWRWWWQDLPQKSQAGRSEINRVLQDLKAGTPRPGSLPGLWFDPPDFPDLADIPYVRELCRRHWDHFQGEWAAIKWRLTGSNRKPPNPMPHTNLERLIAQCQRSTGRRGQAFDLRLDFIEWPRDYERMAAAGHLILGSGYQEAEKADALREVLRQRITALLQAG